MRTIWIKKKIVNWLLKDELQRLQDIEEQYEKMYSLADNAYKSSMRVKDECSKAYQLLDDCQKTMNAVCDVGVDVGMYGYEHSWAVVCVKGKKEYIKFMPLNDESVYDVINFLKKFKYSNKVIDSPLAYRRMVKDVILED